MIFMIIKLFLISLFSLYIYSAQTLKGMGVSLPSSFREDGRGKEQIFLDHLIKDCMKYKYTIKQYPFGRHMIAFSEESFDFVTTVPESSKLKYFQSKSYIHYQNGVSTLKGQKINSLQDLVGKRVITFSGATELIPGLKELVKDFASYSEKAKQEIHSKMLLLGRVDAVISDAVIFFAHTKELKKEKFQMKDLEFHHLFDKTNFTLYFKDKSLRDKFNSCVVKMHKTGKDEKLAFEFYINELYRTLSE